MPSNMRVKKDLSLDDLWLDQVRQDLAAKKDPLQLCSTLIQNHFSLSSIRAVLGKQFPSQALRPNKNLGSHPEWLNWLKINLGQQSDPVEIRDILIINGFNVPSISKHMGAQFPTDQWVGVDYLGLSKVALTSRQQDQRLQKVQTDKLQLFLLEDFLSPAQCSGLISLALDSFHTSGVIRPNEQNDYGFEQPDQGGVVDFAYRNSQTADLGLIPDPLVTEVDEQICQYLGISSNYAELTQIQRYQPGQEYGHHKDYFQPGTDELNVYGGPRGNRTWTFMVYLNEGMIGGRTHFAEIDQMFVPKAGSAVIWNNLLPNGEVNINTTHAGMPVEQGEKFVITKWFREFGFGPIFI